MSLKNLNRNGLNKSVSDTGIVISIEDDLINAAIRGVYYVSQDNYVFVYADSNELKLYADSATSCIIVIVKGKDSSGNDIIGMAHLSRTARFNNFFTMVEQVFAGEIYVYASGANPAEPIITSEGLDYTALRNSDTLRQWISEHAYNPESQEIPPEPVIIGNMIRVGVGNPAVYNNNLDCFGIELSEEAISLDREWLSDAQRDATEGLQTLYCIYGDQTAVRPQAICFTENDSYNLVQAAREQDFEKAASMTDEQILETYSSTPNYEVPWFCDTIRAAATYVTKYPATKTMK